jgi:hypothetical protein
MARRTPPQSQLQRELLRLLRPPMPQLARQVSEQAAPRLAAAARSVGGQPDRAALAEFAEQIEAGENPFL